MTITYFKIILNGVISGGTEAKPFEFPFQGLIGYGKRSNLKFRCGCTLISPRFVLTGKNFLLLFIKFTKTNFYFPISNLSRSLP